MYEQINIDLKQRLERDYEFAKVNGHWWQQGKCPACAKKELFTHYEKPRVLKCGRENKCGLEWHVKDLYPELFERWSERFKATPANPNAAAEAYLHEARGFDLDRIKGWYTQENFYDSEKKIGSATVRFPLAGNAWWERIIDQPGRFGSRKATFRGQYAGTWWQPPSLTDIPDEVWITEGIFNTIALLHHDLFSVSAMSCVNYPHLSLKALAEQCAALDKPRPALVWAFDEGRAGRKYSRLFVQNSRAEGWEATAAMVPRAGKTEPDWNDMHLKDRLGKKDLEEYRYHGALLLAETAQAKALLMYKRHGWNSFSFEFDNRLHWFKLDQERYAKVREQYDDNKAMSDDEKRDMALTESGAVAEIANCYPTALYYQANAVTDESWYYFRIDFPHDGGSVKNTFTGGQLASASEFKKRLLGIAAGAVFTGTAQQLDAMLKRWLGRIKTVQTVDFIGYSKEHGAWVFNDVAVKDGKVVAINDEDFFDIGRLSIKSLSRSLSLKINADLKGMSDSWIPMLWKCYHEKGIVALAFWLGSLFAEQIREGQASFPFIELVGEPGAGKTTLIEFLWKLLGRRDYEGFDPSKSSMAARARNFAQVSNMPVVLIESDRGGEDDKFKQKSFDWDELKPLYNGGSIYSRGVKNSGNDTYEPPFRGALVISQNARVQASDAMMQRICHIGFDLASHTPEGKEAGAALRSTDVELVSGFVLAATQAEKAILDTIFSRTRHHEKRLKAIKGVSNDRIVLNHAQLAAMVDALAHVLPLGPSEIELTHSFIEDMTLERQEAINDDHPLVEEFWDIYDYLNGDEDIPVLNHARKGEDEIAINLNHFMQVASDRRQQVPDLRDMKKLLKTSRTRKFQGIKAVNSVIHARQNENKSHPDAPLKPGTVKCWVFAAPTHRST